MLQQMRRLSKSWLSTLLMGGLALSFALWGIGDIFRGRTSTAVASVGSTDIDQSDFSREYRNTIRVLSRRQQADISQEEARKLGLPRNTLERMLDDAAMANLGSDLGLSVSDETVSREIQSVPAFQGITGTFDHATFVQRVGELGYSEGEFVALMRRDLVRTQLRSAIEDGLSAPVGYVGAFMAYFNEARSVEYVVVTPAMLGPLTPPDGEALAAYVAAHAAQFSTPEYRSVTYAAIGPEDMTDKIQISEKQLRDAYEQKKDQYVVPETREADQISLPTETEARAARAKLDGGMTYDALAASRKLTAKTISMGVVKRDQLTDKAEADALFALPEGGISQPVKGPFGWALLRVRKITPAINKSFDDVRAELATAVKSELATSMIVDIANKFTDAEGAGDDVSQAGRTAGMRVVKIPAVDARGFTPEGTRADIPTQPEFLKAIASADVGIDGDPVQTQDGHLFAIKVTGVTPPKLKSMAVIRDAAIAAWLKDAQAKALARKAADIAAQANRDGALSGAQQSGRLARDTKSDVFSPRLIALIFSKPSGIAVAGPLGKGDGYVVARITGVTHPKIQPNDQNLRGIGRVISQQIGSDASSSLAAAEKTRQGAQINQKMLDQAIGNESA
jgi:peptidyl-prolyl cis-trans isomerase D